MDMLPTMKVKHPDIDGDFMVINEADFDEKVHVRFGEKPRAARGPAEASEPAEVTPEPMVSDVAETPAQPEVTPADVAPAQPDVPAEMPAPRKARK